MTTLSDPQRVILSRATQHDALLAEAPAKLPAAARQSVLRSLIVKGLLEEVPAPRGGDRTGRRRHGHTALARPLNDQGVATARGIGARTHTTVARVMARASGHVTS